MSEETKSPKAASSARPAGGHSDNQQRDNRGDRRRPMGGGRKGGMFRKKVCRFCTQNLKADYKDYEGLRRFVTERGKILPRRITGTCAKHQRVLATEIKKARVLAYLPFEKK